MNNTSAEDIKPRAQQLLKQHTDLPADLTEFLRDIAHSTMPQPVAWRTFDGESGYMLRDYAENETYKADYVLRNGPKYENWVEPLYPFYLPEWAAVVPTEPLTLDDSIVDVTAEALGDAFDCTRQWEAWRYGTMSQNDFELISDNTDRLTEIATAVIRKWLLLHPSIVVSPPNHTPVCGTCTGHGEIGGLLPGDGGYQSDPCPECAVPTQLLSEALRQLRSLEWCVKINVRYDGFYSLCPSCGHRQNENHSKCCPLDQIISSISRHVETG